MIVTYQKWCALAVLLFLAYLPHHSSASILMNAKESSGSSSHRRNPTVPGDEGNGAERLSAFTSSKKRHLRSLMSPPSTSKRHQTKKTTRSLNDTMDWSNIGGKIKGNQKGSQFGDSVAISKDGDVIAVGARFKNTPRAGSNSGVVRIFRRNVIDDGAGVEWVQLGTDIQGENQGDFLGKSLTLSDDGLTMAVGSPKYGEYGMVRVYKFDEENKEWKKLGEDFGGISVEAPIGCYVALSGDGLTLAISWDDHSRNGLCVRIFKLKNGEWIESSTEKLFSIEHNNCPSISLSENGEVLAMGGDEISHSEGDSDHSDDTSKGIVRLFQLIEEEWTQLGQVIDEDVNLGKSVSLSDDGRSFASGGDGIVRVYHLNNEIWIPDKDIVRNNSKSTSFGKSVALSGDGSKVIVGNPQDRKYCLDDNEVIDDKEDNECTDGPGIVQVYERLGTSWNQLGSTLEGRTLLENGDRFGFSVDLSQNGQSIVVGGPNRHNRGQHGYVSVFDFVDLSQSEFEKAPSKAPTDASLPSTSRVVGSGAPLSSAAQISLGTIGGFAVAGAIVFLFVKLRRRRKDHEEEDLLVNGDKTP